MPLLGTLSKRNSFVSAKVDLSMFTDNVSTMNVHKNRSVGCERTSFQHAIAAARYVRYSTFSGALPNVCSNATLRDNKRAAIMHSSTR